MSDHTEIVDALARMQARAVAAEERAATAERQLELSEQDAEIQRTAAVEWFDRCEAAEADAARLRTALVKMHRWAVGPEPQSEQERAAYFAAVREADAALAAARAALEADESEHPKDCRCDVCKVGTDVERLADAVALRSLLDGVAKSRHVALRHNSRWATCGEPECAAVRAALESAPPPEPPASIAEALGIEVTDADKEAYRTDLAAIREAEAPPIPAEYEAVGYRFTHATSDGHLMRGCPPIMPPEQTWEPVFVRRASAPADLPDNDWDQCPRCGGTGVITFRSAVAPEEQT